MERDARNTVIAFVDHVWNDCRVDLVPSLIHPDYSIDGTRIGPDWVIENMLAYHAAFPDLKFSLLHCLHDEEEIATLVRMQGTHLAEWKGIPASGRSVDCREAGFWRVTDGKIIAASFVAESLALRIQLGQIPPTVWQGKLLTE
jgi:predicted ester cyclase